MRKYGKEIEGREMSLLETLRVKRGFDAEKTLHFKIKLINDFFREEKLNSAVIGISGGFLYFPPRTPRSPKSRQKETSYAI